MKVPFIKKLNLPAVIQEALSFEPTGKIAVSKNNLTYLDIDDQYIHQLFPLLNDKKIKKPDYFNDDGSVGAHITVIYPEENKMINREDLYAEHRFVINDIVAAEIRLKTYYVLLVESPSLLELRRKYGLPEQLCFKGYSTGFHVTIGCY